jgi:hypothetical protein
MNHKQQFSFIFLAIILLVAVDAFFIVKYMNSKAQRAGENNKEAFQGQSDFSVNRASVYCAEQGGTLLEQLNERGGNYVLCYFEDGKVCEQWAMLRGDCPVGGIDVSGLATEAQKFCVLCGGKISDGNDMACSFKDGSVCRDENFYNGTCLKGEFRQLPE